MKHFIAVHDFEGKAIGICTDDIVNMVEGSFEYSDPRFPNSRIKFTSPYTNIVVNHNNQEITYTVQEPVNVIIQNIEKLK